MRSEDRGSEGPEATWATDPPPLSLPGALRTRQEAGNGMWGVS